MRPCPELVSSFAQFKEQSMPRFLHLCASVVVPPEGSNLVLPSHVLNKNVICFLSHIPINISYSISTVDLNFLMNLFLQKHINTPFVHQPWLMWLLIYTTGLVEHSLKSLTKNHSPGGIGNPSFFPVRRGTKFLWQKFCGKINWICQHKLVFAVCSVCRLLHLLLTCNPKMLATATTNIPFPANTAQVYQKVTRRSIFRHVKRKTLTARLNRGYSLLSLEIYGLWVTLFTIQKLFNNVLASLN